MPHSCDIVKADNELEKQIKILGKGSEWREKWIKYILISDDHPSTCYHFKSKKAIMREKIRHIQSGYTYIIHPLSRFQQVYTFYRLFLYVIVVFLSPFESTVTRKSINDTHRYITRFVNLLTQIDIILTFFTGFIKYKSKTIELKPSKIARKYIFGPFFIVDVLGSTKFYQSMIPYRYRPMELSGIVKVFGLMRSIRIWTLLKLIYHISLAINIKSKTLIFSICSLVLFIFTMHFFTCFLIGSTIIIRYNFNAPDPLNYSDIHVYEVYFDYMFKSSAFLLGICLPKQYFQDMEYLEDYITTIFTYLIGKLLLISTWLIIALSILSTKSTYIKFQKILNEVEEYMIQKQVPLHLREKIISYYNFKYQQSYFKEDFIQFLLPENLHKDINMGICKSLVSSVSIFQNLDREEISEIVQLLIPEVVLPNSLIIQSGTTGDSMYFIASGTVAVYSHSGMEICHLQDGAYFGEISMVLKDRRRSATVVAVETSQLYRLNKSDFQNTLMKHKKVYADIILMAENRLRHTLRLEEIYKKKLFEKAYAESMISAH